MINVLLYVICFVFGLWLGAIEGYRAGKEDMKNHLFDKYECGEKDEHLG